MFGSPAINAGDNAGCPITDQRGTLRPQGASCDIGAYEFDLTPPETTVIAGPTGPTTDTTPTFEFNSSEPGSVFLCRTDGGVQFACTSPLTLPEMTVAPHTFEVLAVDSFGNADQSPASIGFSIVLPPPVLGKTFNIELVSGKVLIASASGPQLTGARAAQKGRRFVPLTDPRQLTIGSFVDTKKGRARITTAVNETGKTNAGAFFKGLFQVLQARKGRQKGLTTMRLKGSSFKRCRSAGRGKRGKGKLALAAARKRLGGKTIRKLEANARGRFRTRGRHSSATVRGTSWLTADRCKGTLTRVRRGKVAVRDFRRRKTIVVSTGKSYLARPRG